MSEELDKYDVGKLFKCQEHVAGAEAGPLLRSCRRSRVAIKRRVFGTNAEMHFQPSMARGKRIAWRSHEGGKQRQNPIHRGSRPPVGLI